MRWEGGQAATSVAPGVILTMVAVPFAGSRDGLVDLVVGAGLVAVNTGTASKPAFGKGLTKEELPAGVVALLSDTTIAGADVAGAFVDMDGDGDLDFIHGLDGSTLRCVPCVVACGAVPPCMTPHVVGQLLQQHGVLDLCGTSQRR